MSTKRLGILAAAIATVLAIPAGAGAAANGNDCTYTTTGGANAGVQAGSGGMTGTAGTAVGACVNTGLGLGADGGSVEIGTGPSGSYGVIDGDNQNADPADGYMGLSNYETGGSRDEQNAPGCDNGPDQGAAGSSNSGGCFGLDGGPWVYLYDVLPAAVPTPICGNSSGSQWWSTTRDGCSNP